MMKRRRAQAPLLVEGLASLKYAGGFPSIVPGGTGESTRVERPSDAPRKGSATSLKHEPPDGDGTSQPETGTPRLAHTNRTPPPFGEGGTTPLYGSGG